MANGLTNNFPEPLLKFYHNLKIENSQSRENSIGMSPEFLATAKYFGHFFIIVKSL